MMKNYFEILGYKVTDKVTGFEGVATSVSFDLYGCVQVLVRPQRNEKNQLPEGHWLDHSRLVISTKIMEPITLRFPETHLMPGPEKKPSQ